LRLSFSSPESICFTEADLTKDTWRQDKPANPRRYDLSTT
jgi:hypothetical protein